MNREQARHAVEAIEKSGKPRKAKNKLLADVAEALDRYTSRGEARKARLAAWLKVGPEFIDFLLWNLIIMILVLMFIVVSAG